VAVPSGLIHNVADDDQGALDQVRTYLSYFPRSAWSYPPSTVGGDQEPRAVPELLSIVPRNNRRVYDMREVLDAVTDDGDWFEIQPGFGAAIICALARLGGHPIAIVANQPKVMAGAIDANAADKAAHMIMVADSFHLPLVFLSDNPGMLPGTRSERDGVLSSGARMFAAQTQATSIKLHLTLRKAYGFGSMVMGMIAYDSQSATFSFPGATLGAMGARASSSAMHAGESDAAMLHDAELQASFNSARRLGFDELIDPRETRNALLASLHLAVSRRQAHAEPKARYGITP
jgi:acetyl-CoA carboxylase carboxyltransferase component